MSLWRLSANVCTVPQDGYAHISAHDTAYAVLHRVVYRAGSSWHDRKIADRYEEQALLAICSYSATSRGDRRAKADYLLTVEARGELDLEEHMQAILHSIMQG
jgi:hypothetical protein